MFISKHQNENVSRPFGELVAAKNVDQYHWKQRDLRAKRCVLKQRYLKHVKAPCGQQVSGDLGYRA